MKQCYNTYHISRLSAAFEGERDKFKKFLSPVVKMEHGSIEMSCELSSDWLYYSWIIQYWCMFKI